MTTNSKNQKKKPIRTDNFVEALRGLGSGVTKSAVEDVIKGLPETAFSQLAGKVQSGELKPGETLTLEKNTPNSPEQSKRKFYQEFLNIRHQEKLVFSQEQQETQLQIKAIQEELKKLAQSTQGLIKEVEVAAQQAPVEPGIYHLSFFEKLREAILFFKKRIEESTTWMTAFNQKAKKRNYYWGQVKKSGTKFMLSHERSVATQTG